MGKKKVIDSVISLLGAKEDIASKKAVKKERQKMSEDFSSADTLREDLNQMDEFEIEEYLEEQGLDEFDLMDMGVIDLADDSVQEITEKNTLAFFSYSPKDAGKNWVDSGNTNNLLEYMSTELDDPKKLREFMDGLADDTVTFDDFANEDIQNHAANLLEEMKTLRVVKNKGSLLRDIPKSQFAEKDIKAAEEALDKRRDFFERNGEVLERVPLEDMGEDMPSSFLRRATTEETSKFKKGRENFRVGKLVKDLLGDKPTTLKQEISERLHRLVEREVEQGATKKEAFKEISESTKIPISEIKENEKIFSRQSGGGASKNMLDEVILTGKSLLKEPTALQKAAENIAGGKGTKSTRIARSKAGKAAIGAYLLGELDLPPEKASEFEQAFSEAHNAGKETFTFDGKEFSTEVKKGKAMGGRLNYQEGGSLMVPPERQPYVFGALAKLRTKASKALLQEATNEVKAAQKNIPQGSKLSSFTQRIKERNETFSDFEDGPEEFGEFGEPAVIPQSLVDMPSSAREATLKSMDDLEELFSKDPKLSKQINNLKTTVFKKIKDKEAAESFYEAALFKISERFRSKAKDVASDAQLGFPESTSFSINASDVDNILSEIGEDRIPKQEGGSLLVPPEMEAVAEDIPVDTYPNISPEEMAEVEASQLPDVAMEKDYMDFVVGESLDSEEQNYLINALEADPQLSQIFGKVVTTASEFTGSGEVSGPGTGVSDSIPARLSDGEFVFTKKATDQMGSDNLQMMMDDAERAFDGGEMRMPKQEGGSMMYKQKDEDPLAYEKIAQDEIKKSMLKANRAPSLMMS